MYWKTAVERALSKKSIEDAMETAARDILPDVSDRIFTQGKSTSGDPIGEYSEDPIYISKNNSPRAAGIPKEKTYFFPGGYKEFKREIGRGETVNWKVFGRLQQDYLTPKKVSTTSGVQYRLKEEKNIDKKDGLEDKYKIPVFDLSKTERDRVAQTVNFEIARRINR